jgi:hypothetical protein
MACEATPIPGGAKAVTPQKLLITLTEYVVAPRFDLATEVFISAAGTGQSAGDGKTLVLAHPSAEDLCQLILDESIEVVICGGIEKEFYDYLTWKEIVVVDSVSGPWERALELFRRGRLKPGDILHVRPGDEGDGPEPLE